MYLIARDTYKISLREGDDRRSHPGPLRKNVTICITQACTTPVTYAAKVHGASQHEVAYIGVTWFNASSGKHTGQRISLA